MKIQDVTKQYKKVAPQKKIRSARKEVASRSTKKE